MVNEIVDENTNEITIKDQAKLVNSMGGPERLKKIQNFLDDLRNANVTVKVVSTSWYPITEDQWQEYLAYVSDFLKLGFSKDEILAVEDPGEGLSADKGRRIRDDQNITVDDFVSDAMFADDSTGNIRSAINVTNLLWMEERKGLGEGDIKYIKYSIKMDSNAGTMDDSSDTSDDNENDSTLGVNSFLSKNNIL